MTPGEEMIFEGKKLRVQELPKELDLLQESIVHAGRRLTELIPELPERTCYKKADDLFSGPSTLEILIKNTARLATSAQKLERLGKENPYSEEKTQIACDSIRVLLCNIAHYTDSAVSAHDIQEIQELLDKNSELLSEDEIDALLTDWGKTGIDLSGYPDESKAQTYNRLHGIGIKPQFALVHAEAETWLEEKYVRDFWGWAYAMQFLSELKNKKTAYVREYPCGCYPWISRYKEFQYEFDGDTVKTETDLPRIVKGYENEAYLGVMPDDIPPDAAYREQKELIALPDPKRRRHGSKQYRQTHYNI